MAYVNVPKDLNKVKNKILFNMTKRQLICLAVAFVVGVPFYFLTKGVLGTGNAATGMVMLCFQHSSLQCMKKMECIWSRF